jgi:hypothetical protein
MNKFLLIVSISLSTVLKSQTIDSSGYNSIKNCLDSIHEQVQIPCSNCDNGFFTLYLVDKVIMEQKQSDINLSHVNNRANLIEAHCEYRTHLLYSTQDSIFGKSIRVVIIGNESIIRTRVKVQSEALLEDSSFLYKTFDDSLIRTTVGYLDSPAVYIESIEFAINGRVIEVDNTIFDEFFHVNFTDIWKHVNPITIFYNQSNSTINLYIFSYYRTNDNQVMTYVAKLIFSSEGEYIGKLIANTYDLIELNCYYSNFIGF